MRKKHLMLTDAGRGLLAQGDEKASLPLSLLEPLSASAKVDVAS